MTGTKPNQPEVRRQFLILLCLPALVWAGTPAPDAGPPPLAERRVFDRAVASIGGQLVTLSQLEFEARVLLVNAGGVAAAFVTLDQDTLAKSLEAVIDQHLATFEADKLDAYPLEAGEGDKALQSFRSRFLSEDRFRTFLAAHEADTSDLAQVLRRQLRAQRVLEGKLRLKAQLSEPEARRLQAERADLRGLPPALARQKLLTERFNELVRAELRQARRTTDIRLLGPFAPGAGGEGR